MHKTSVVRALATIVTLVAGVCTCLHTATAKAQNTPASQPAVPTPTLPGTPFASVTGMKCTGGKEHNHIIYLMDTSGSMRDGDKILKLQAAVKRTLLELRPSDTFNIMNFDFAAHVWSADMSAATPENIQKASAFIDTMKLRPYTNWSDTLDKALQSRTVTQIFLMSDGEPNTGIEDLAKLREFIKAKNTRHIHINTIALGLGERFKGMRMMYTLAQDNAGQYSYMNLEDNTASSDFK